MNKDVTILVHDDGKGNDNSHETLMLIATLEGFEFNIRTFGESREESLRKAYGKLNQAISALNGIFIDFPRIMVENEYVVTDSSVNVLYLDSNLQQQVAEWREQRGG